MGLNWSTFLLEIINFLILLWILQRFLYRPIQDIIMRRRATIQTSLAQARAEHAQAELLQREYADRQANWQREREQARTQLAEEIAAERKRQLASLRTELDTERQKAVTIAVREAEATRRQQEQSARELASAFASRLLTRLASPELERSLIAMALQDLAKLDSGCHARLCEATGPIEAITAFALPVSEQAALRRTVESELGTKGEWRFTQQPELVAGLRLRIGAWVLQANLHDELAFFH